MTMKMKSRSKPSVATSSGGEEADLQLVSEQVNLDTGVHHCTVRYRKRDGWGRTTIKREQLGEPRALRRQLLGLGASSLPRVKDECERMEKEMPPLTIQTTSRGGWHGDFFVSRYGVVRPPDAQSRMRFDTTDLSYRAAQSTQRRRRYQKALRVPLECSHYLTFVLAAALTPVLADRIGRTGGCVFCMSQQSTAGKSLTSRVALSAATAAPETALESLNKTTARAVQLLAASGGCCIPFADLKSAQAKQKDLVNLLQTLVFSVTDGSQRETLVSGGGQPPRFTILLLTAERPMAEIFEEAGVLFEQGDAVRFIDIGVPEREDGGIFHSVAPPAVSPAEMAEMTEAAIERDHGTLLPRWARRLMQQEKNELAIQVKELESQFLARLGTLSALELRLARPFALVAAAGSLAAGAGYFPVSSERVVTAVKALCDEARARLAPIHNNAKGVAAASFIEMLRDEALFPVATMKQSVPDPSKFANGMRRVENGTTWLYVRRGLINTHFSDGRRTLALSLLKAAGVCVPGKAGNTVTCLQKGLGKKRYYRFNYDLLIAQFPVSEA